MTRPLVDRLVLVGALTLTLTLCAVGLGTSLLLYAHEARAVDDALLAAAHAYRGDQDWTVEHSRPPLTVRLARAQEPDLPPEWLAEARRTEEVTWHTLGQERVLLALLERGEEGRREDHALLIARAPRVTPRTLAPFTAIYLVVSAVVMSVAVVSWRRLASDAVKPMLRAREDILRVVGAGFEVRLPVGGPPEVTDLLSAVNELLGRLERAAKVQSRFASEAAHELRTPLTALQGELEVALRRERTPQEYRQVLEDLQGDVRRLGRMVEGLLTLARVDAGQADQDREWVTARQVADAAARQEEAGLLAGGGRLDLVVLRDAPCRVQASLLAVALSNLLRNAAVHAPGAPVRLTVDAEGGQIRWAVEDAGSGLPEADWQAVFDRPRRSPGGGAGLGLGLPLAKEIARRHGGDCYFEAPKWTGGGTRAVLTIPAGPNAAEAPSR